MSGAVGGVNPERGELELVLGDTSYRLRPTFAANNAIERKTECSLLQLAHKAGAYALTLAELGTIAAEWIKAGAEDELTQRVSAERIAELIYEHGIAGVTARLAIGLVEAITGGRTAAGEAKAAPASATTGAATGN